MSQQNKDELKSFDDLTADEDLVGVLPQEVDEVIDQTTVDVSNESLFEAVLFLSGDPLPINFFVKNIGVPETEAKIILASLMDE